MRVLERQHQGSAAALDIYGYRSWHLYIYKLHTVYIHAYSIHALTHTHTLKLCIPCSRAIPLTSRTHAHLIGVSRIGASLQHRAQAGRESEACPNKQERILVVVRDVDLRKVLRKRCLHLVRLGELKRRVAALSEKGRRQGVRGAVTSTSSLSSVNPV